jgi:hypothetical protein
MTNDEFKMTKEIRVTNRAQAGCGAVLQTKVGNGRRGGRVFGHSEFDIPSALVIGHWSFCWLKA